MAITVKKYGGASIETIELIDNLASKLVKAKKKGDDIVVVVSAMARTTDHLFSLAKQICHKPYQRELDMLVTAGERISMALLSIALHKYGLPAISFTGSQSGIITNNSHGNARIVNVNAFRIKDELKKGKIVIVAGYQGVSTDKEITTLGRGGSDTTAVALAAYLKADRCEMYKDVEGIFSADPKNVENAEKIHSIDYRSMLSLCHAGCKAVHSRAIEFAMRYNVALEVRSAFVSREGTMIEAKERNMEDKRITALTCKKKLVLIDIKSTDIALTLNILRDINSELDVLELTASDRVRLTIADDQAEVIMQRISLHNSNDIINTQTVSSLSLIGFNMNEVGDTHLEMIKLLDAHNAEIVWMKMDTSYITFYLKTKDASLVEQQFHDKFIRNPRD